MSKLKDRKKRRKESCNFEGTVLTDQFSADSLVSSGEDKNKPLLGCRVLKSLRNLCD